ncbi:MAG: hypothetical protein OHK0023_21070 [Anaerolineae bacterium]
MQHPNTTRLHFMALLLYISLAFLIMHAMIFRVQTHFAGFDYFNYHWNMWFIRHAFTTPDVNIYQNDFTFYPYLANYGYHALASFWYPLWAVLEPFVGTKIAVNGIIFVGCVLNGYLLFALIWRETNSPSLALIGGAAWQAFPIVRYSYFNTHLNLMNWWWLPAQVMLWAQTARAVRERRYRQALFWAFTQSIAFWGMGLSEHQFLIFTAFVLGPYGLVTLWMARHDVRQLAALIGFGLLTVTIFGVLYYFAGPLRYILTFEGQLAAGNVEVRPGIPFPSGFLSMSETWWQWDTPSMGVFVTLVLIGALVASIVYRKRIHNRWRWFWLLIGLPPLILALGPSLKIGDLSIPMPYRVMYTLTGGMFGMPWRLAPIFSMGVFVFAAFTFAPLLKPVDAANPRANHHRTASHRRLFAVVAVLLILFFSVRLGESAPLTPYPPEYAKHRAIAAEPDTKPIVVDVPTGVGTGEVLIGDPRAIQLQWYGMAHGRRTINGFISRAPVQSFFYIETGDPMLSWLGGRIPLDPTMVENQLRERIFSYPIGYFVIHTDLIPPNAPALQEIVGFFNRFPDLLCPPTFEGAAIFYRTRAETMGCETDRTPPHTETGVHRIEVGAIEDQRYLGWGWHWREQVFDVNLRWTGEYPQAVLYVNLPPQHDYTFTFAAQAFFEPRQVRIRVNGEILPETVQIAVESLARYTFTIPSRLLQSGGQNEIALVYDKTLVPREIGQSADERRLAIAVDWLEFAPR